MNYNYESARFGSARAATPMDLKRARIIGGQGAGFGFDDSKRHELRVPGDGSIALFGGAGCGKSSGPFAQALLGNQIGNAICFDPRGELTAISMLAASLAGYAVYVINPTGMAGLPQHTCNIHEHLRIGSPSLIADAQKTAMDYCPLPTSRGNAQWVYEDAQDWLTQLTLFDAERSGCASLTGLYELLTAIQGNLDKWCAYLDQMMTSRFTSVRRFAGQIMNLQNNGRESFTAPLGTLHTTFRFMQDPRIASALSGHDFSLRWLADSERKVRVFVILPIEYLEVWAPAMRQTLGAPIQHKLRSPGGSPLAVLIDECGQLKNFPSVRELYTFGRGAGLRGLCAWQEISQIQQAFGHEGANEIIGSAQIRVFKGVRTLETAQLVSRMCGTMTLEYDARTEQSNARRLKQRAALRVLSGGSFFEAAADIRHYADAAQHRTKQARALLSADEVLNLPPSAMVAFASGLLEGPILGHWLMYFERPELAGRYLPNPYHDNTRARIQTRRGPKWAYAIEESVPASLAHLPQYRNGVWRYIEGYRPPIR